MWCGSLVINPSRNTHVCRIIRGKHVWFPRKAVDKYINMELIFDVGTDGERCGVVKKRSRGLDGRPIGRAHTNPMFDSREYEVEFGDGSIRRWLIILF